MSVANARRMHRTSSERHWLCGLAAGLFFVAGCGAPSPIDSEEVERESGPLSPRYGVDYSWANPSPAHLKSEGYTFAARYLSYVPGKNLTHTEANALIAEGIDVVSNWEWDQNDALGGYSAGVQ